MPRDKTVSHARVLAAARDEFLQYGYEGASMRRIGKNAGMTAAGIYRHCDDKAALFAELVQPAVDRIEEWQRAHMARNTAVMDAGAAAFWQESEIDLMREIIYPHMEEYRLLLTSAEGTAYEGFVSGLVERNTNEMLALLPLLRETGYPVREIDARELRLLLSAYTNALFEPVLHEYGQDEALRYLDTVAAFFLPGWKQLLGF